MMIADLRKLTDEELIKRHDAHAYTVTESVNDFRNELARRDAEASDKRMTALTASMHKMTIAITVMTLINLVVACVGVAATIAGLSRP